MSFSGVLCYRNSAYYTLGQGQSPRPFLHCSLCLEITSQGIKVSPHIWDPLVLPIYNKDIHVQEKYNQRMSFSGVLCYGNSAYYTLGQGQSPRPFLHCSLCLEITSQGTKVSPHIWGSFGFTHLQRRHLEDICCIPTRNVRTSIQAMVCLWSALGFQADAS